MSKIAVNEITDEVGTGAPAFPNGMSVTGAALTDPEITGGIYLGGTGSANYLDDYEEGTFTPEVSDGSGGNMTVSTSQVGAYVKVGDLVFISITLTSITKSGSGELIVTGLPFSVGSSANAADCSAMIRWEGINTDTQMIGYFNELNTEIRMQQFSTSGFNGSVNISDANSSFDFYNITGSYRAA